MTSFRLLGATLRVEAEGGAAATVLKLTEALAEIVQTPPDTTLTVFGAPGSWRVAGEALDITDFPIDGSGPGTELEPLLLAAVTRAVLARTPLLVIHAAVVAAPDGLVVIPGASGHGKTTLAAALVRRGWGYVSDEVLAVDRTTGAVTPFARPLSLSPDSWSALGLDPLRCPAPGAEGLVAPAELGSIAVPGQVRHVLLTARRPGPPAVAPGRPGAAVRALLASAFNHYRAPRESLQTVLDLVRSAQVWDVGYAEAPELADMLCDVRLAGQAWAATAAR